MITDETIDAASADIPANSIDAVTQAEDQIIARGLTILTGRMRTDREVFASPTTVRQYCQLRLGARAHEVFAVLFLDAQNRLIECREMFRGTLTQTSVYPREVVKECLELNAAAVILVHNHPSGEVQPSRADEALTQTLKTALALVDVRVLDHVIVSAVQSLSMAERGLL
jgi:DNA repair protein RadC